MKVFSYIKNYLEFVVYYLLKIILGGNKKNENTLLLINTGEIGDLVVSSILLENPHAFDNFEKVKFLVKDQYLKLFSNYKGRIEFIGYNYNNYKYSIIYKIKLLKNLRDEGFSKVINLTAARGILNEELTHLCDGEVKIALNSFWEYLGNSLGKYFDKKYDLIIGKEYKNEYDKHIELIKFLSKPNNIEIVFNNGFTFDEKIHKVEYELRTIVIAPFSSKRNRDWSCDNFRILINELSKTYKIILLGSVEQKNELFGLINGNDNIEVLADCLKLNEIPFIIKSARLFIGLDSGITHIALKMDVPIIAIIGGGEFGRFFPYKESKKVKYLYNKLDCFFCHWKCLKSEMFCITEIKPIDVLKLVPELIN